MKIKLIYPAILAHLITIGLYINSKDHDKYLLFFMMIGQLILISGEINNDVKLIELSHIYFTVSIIIGSLYFKEIKNIYFIGIFVILRFITHFIYKGCLFNMSSNNYEYSLSKKISDFIDWNIIYFIILLVIIYRIYYLSI